jgi:transcriptional regulator
VEAAVSSVELRKGSVELLLLSILETGPSHGYEIGKLVEQRSGGRIRFRISSLYPVLCRMEDRGWIEGWWVEKPGERRRRFYRLTGRGVKALAEQRETWDEFTYAVNLVLGPSHA